MLPQESTNQLGIDVSISTTQGCASLGLGLLCLPRSRIHDVLPLGISSKETGSWRRDTSGFFL